jgi:protein-S-isoprenylcysteine O-methyltransferase Ste14
MAANTPSLDDSESTRQRPSHIAQAAAIAVFFEKRVLPFVFFFMAWRELTAVYQLSTQIAPTLDSLSMHFAASLRHLLLFLLQLFVGLMLLLNARPIRQPANLKEIIVPIISSFLFLAYGAVAFFPASWQRILIPVQWQTGLTISALILAIIGYSVSTWGVMSLGRSFALIVSVREVVFRGPYRYVRHPIYFGYSCAIFGMVLANFSATTLLIVTIHFLLFVYRARLEERRLAEYSQEYQEYVKHTGFIFPRFRTSPRF